jgi:GT2 family glycosyltransferase
MDGVYAAQSDVVLFLNNDIVVEPDFLEPLLKHFTDPTVFGVTARIKEATTGLDQGARTAGVYHRGMLYYQIKPHVNRITNTFFAVGGQSAFDRKKLLELGGLDRLYWPLYDEDIDLSYRAWKRGWLVKYEPNSVIHHLGSVTSKKVFTQEQLDCIKAKNRLLLIWKNINDPELFRQHLLWLGPRLIRSRFKLASDSFYKGFVAARRQFNEVCLARKQASYHARLTDRQVFDIIKDA